MRTLAILTYEFPVVSETFIVDHAVGMVRRGWNTAVVCLRTYPERLAPVLRRAPSLRVLQVKPIRMPSRQGARELLALAGAGMVCHSALRARPGRKAFIMASGFSRAIREVQPDVVHAHFGPVGVAASMALRGRVPLVVDFHGYDFTVFPGEWGWNLYRRWLRSCRVVVHSGFAAQRVQAGIGVPVRVVRLGVDLQHFPVQPRGTEWNAPLRLLVVGRLVPVKGQLTAIRALAALRRGESPLHARLRIVGDGPELQALVAEAAASGVTEHVEFTGAVSYDRVAAEMAATDVLLVPSVIGPGGAVEAFGRVAIEGLATGLPVIASDIGGLPEAVGEAGMLVPAGNPAALADAIRALIATETPARCAGRAVQRAAMFSLDRMWDEYADVARAACRCDFGLGS